MSIFGTRRRCVLMAVFACFVLAATLGKSMESRKEKSSRSSLLNVLQEFKNKAKRVFRQRNVHTSTQQLVVEETSDSVAAAFASTFLARRFDDRSAFVGYIPSYRQRQKYLENVVAQSEMSESSKRLHICKLPDALLGHSAVRFVPDQRGIGSDGSLDNTKGGCIKAQHDSIRAKGKRIPGYGTFDFNPKLRDVIASCKERSQRHPATEHLMILFVTTFVRNVGNNCGAHANAIVLSFADKIAYRFDAHGSKYAFVALNARRRTQFDQTQGLFRAFVEAATSENDWSTRAVIPFLDGFVDSSEGLSCPETRSGHSFPADADIETCKSAGPQALENFARHKMLYMQDELPLPADAFKYLATPTAAVVNECLPKSHGILPRLDAVASSARGVHMRLLWGHCVSWMLLFLDAWIRTGSAFGAKHAIETILTMAAETASGQWPSKSGATYPVEGSALLSRSIRQYSGIHVVSTLGIDPAKPLWGLRIEDMDATSACDRDCARPSLKNWLLMAGMLQANAAMDSMRVRRKDAPSEREKAVEVSIREELASRKFLDVCGGFWSQEKLHEIDSRAASLS